MTQQRGLWCLPFSVMAQQGGREGGVEARKGERKDEAGKEQSERRGVWVGSG